MVILFQYVVDYVILTTVGQFKHGIAFRPHCKHGIAFRSHCKHGIAIALANAFERPSTGNHFGLPLSTVCVIGIRLCHLTSFFTWNCI